MKKIRGFLSIMLSLAMLGAFIPTIEAVALTDNVDTSFSSMLERAEALINYEWVPSERIYTWNDNEYNGKNYFEAGETVKGVPYTLFTWELGFDSLLSLEQYKSKSAVNYSTTRYCNSVSAQRIGPVYGTCCATFVSEVFGGSFMNGSNPRYDNVGSVCNSTYSTTYKNVKASAIQPGDALSCTSGAHIVWVGDVTDKDITIYESTPPICQKVILDKASHTDSNGYLVYKENTYNIVTKSNEIIRDDLTSVAKLASDIPMPIHAYTKNDEKTVVYDGVGGNAKTNKIYGTDLCFIDSVFDNGWCHVNFPLDAGGLEQGYVETSVFFDNSDIKVDTVKISVPVYARSDLSTSLERVLIGNDTCFIGETTNAYQIVYPVTSGGYKLGWVSKEDLANAPEEPFLNQLCPMKGYPCVAENFEVKKGDYSTRGGEIYTTDYCTINEIYSDGWCKVTFPMDSGGERTAYTPISNFIYDSDYKILSYVTDKKIDVYTKKDLQQCNNWWTGIGDTIFIIGEYKDALQICYPIDETYGGGYKLGWIPRSEISVEPENPDEPDIVLTSISVNTLPNKTSYFVGEEFDTTGFSLLLNCSDGTTKTITNAFTVSSPDMTTAGTKTVTVTYQGKTATFTIVVNPKEEPNPNSAKILIENKNAIIGDTVEVAVKLENNPGIASMTLRVNYDSSAMKLISVTDAGKLGTAVHSDKYSSPYTLCWVNDTATKDFTENGTIAILKFQILDNAVIGSYPISVSYDYENFDIYNVNVEKVKLEPVNGSITVSNVLIGDVNNDGTVNNLDRLVLTRYLANWVDYPESAINMTAADVNMDGTVNNLDRLILTRHLANWENYSELLYAQQ